MKTRWLFLTLLLSGVLVLIAGCDLRVEDTPVPPVTAKPTSPVATQPVVGPVQPTQATTAAPTPDLLARPQMTVLGQLASGVPHGVTADGHYFKGDPQAPVMVIEFSEYQCPFCARYVRETLPQIQENYIATGKVVYIFKNFPLPGHPQAEVSAEAAECAGKQGYYWPMHDYIFANQSEWSGKENALEVLMGYGDKVALDTAAYRTCLAEHQTLQHIRDDYKYGQSIGVPATPAFLLIGKSIQGMTGAQPFSAFQQAIGNALESLNP